MPIKRITTIEVYRFDELEDEAKQRAIDNNRDWNVADSDWYRYTFEAWRQLLSSIGIEDAQIGFSGFGRQGDGACIWNAWFDPNKLSAFMANIPKPCGSWGDESESALQAVLVYKLGGINRIQGDSRIWDWISFFNVLDEFSFSIRTVNRHYLHENCHKLELEGYTGRDNVDSTVNGCVDDLNELRRSLCQAIYSDLQEYYEYLTSDSAIAESLEANECKFDVTGNIAN